MKLDLGCGQIPREGFTGVDIVKTSDAVIQHNLLTFPWPFEPDSVEEVWCSHFFEHVPGRLRGAWMDELYRVMKTDAKATIIVPWGMSVRAVQDFTHEWPPVVEASFLYFNRDWRTANKLDHYPVTCDFDFAYGYAFAQEWQNKHQDARTWALTHYLNVASDLQVGLTKRPAKPRF